MSKKSAIITPYGVSATLPDPEPTIETAYVAADDSFHRVRGARKTNGLSSHDMPVLALG